MEEIIEKLFNLLDTVAYSGCLTDEEEIVLEQLEKEYNMISEGECIFTCPKCGEKIKL